MSNMMTTNASEMILVGKPCAYLDKAPETLDRSLYKDVHPAEGRPLIAARTATGQSQNVFFVQGE